MTDDQIRDMRTTISELISDLRLSVFTSLNDQADLVNAETFFGELDGTKLMKHVNDHVLPHRVQIKKREIDFFVKQKNHIFGGLSKSKVDRLVKLIQNDESNGGMSQETKDVIWSYFDVMITIVSPDNDSEEEDTKKTNRNSKPKAIKAGSVKKSTKSKTTEVGPSKVKK